MFGGIVEGTGIVRVAAPDRGGMRLVVAAGRLGRGLKLGASVCVSGVCLTVERLTAAGLGFRLVPETLRRTNLGGLRAGARVNLERSLRLGSPVDGHLVAGHVDGVGVVRAQVREGNGVRMRIAAPAEVMRYVTMKGSIAVDGVSLTVAGVVRRSSFAVALIPHTLRITTLGAVQPGSRVNLEADLMARYAERARCARRVGRR